MSEVKEKTSYLRGLADGLQITDQAQAKLNAAIIDALDSIADAIEDNEASIFGLDENISDIYDALDEIEDELDDDLDEEFDEDDFIEVQCPHCGDIIYFDDDMLEDGDELICPCCNKQIISDDEEDDTP